MGHGPNTKQVLAPTHTNFQLIPSIINDHRRIQTKNPVFEPLTAPFAGMCIRMQGFPTFALTSFSKSETFLELGSQKVSGPRF